MPGFFIDERVRGVDVFRLGIIEHAAAESNHITAQVNDGDHHPVAEVVIAGSAAVFIAAARKVGVYKFRFGIALLPHVTQEPIPSVRRTAKPKMADYFSR